MIDDYPFGTLRRVKIEQVHSTTRMAFSRLEFSTNPGGDYFADRLIAQLDARVYAAKQPPAKVNAKRTYQYEVPRTWWDHWKLAHAESWYARWWIKRHPARMLIKGIAIHVEVPIDPAIAFPDAPMPAGRYGEPVYMLVVDEPEWTLDGEG